MFSPGLPQHRFSLVLLLYISRTSAISRNFRCCYAAPRTEGHLPLQHGPNYSTLDRMAPAFRAAGRDTLRAPCCPLRPKHPGRSGRSPVPLFESTARKKRPPPFPRQ